MKFIHSWWSIPALRNRWHIDYLTQVKSNIYFYTLSTLYCKNINQEIELHTDSLGAKLLEWLPYNNIIVDLDTIPIDTTIGLWACSKFYCMEHEPLDSIHIDGDVFIKDLKCINKINELSTSDCVVQHIEYLESELNNIYSDSMGVISHLKFSKGCSTKLINAYNTGILKFNNIEFKKLYFDNYWSMYHQIQGDQAVKDWYDSHAGWSADIILEQLQLYDLSEYHGYKVSTLLEYDDDKKLTPSANKIGYTHVIGDRKYQFDILDLIKIRIKELDYEVYDYLVQNESRFENIIENYKSSKLIY